MFLCINLKAVPRRAEQEAQARAFRVLAGRGEHSSDFGQTALTAFQAVKNVHKPLRSARKKKRVQL
jgi:hypothetical protein